MALDSTTISTLETTINTQVASGVKGMQDAVGNRIDKVPILDQITAHEKLSAISVKRARTSMFDKFKFARK